MILRTKDSQRLFDIFSSVDYPFEVWAYGSRVNGTAHEGSDLDLVIRTQSLQKLPLHVLQEIKDKIRNSNIPIVVEIFDWARLPEHFHKAILEQHEKFFSKSAEWMNEPQTDYPAEEDKPEA